MISVLIFSFVHALFDASTGFIASTVVVALSPDTRVASSSFLVHRQSILRTPFASVIVYAAISPTFPIVSTLPLSEKDFCAAVVAWMFKNFASVRSDHFGSKVIISLSPVGSLIHDNLSSGSLYTASRYFPYTVRSLFGLSNFSAPIPCPVSY